MDIPSPPLWQNLLFENPWPLAGVLLVIGVALRAFGRQTGQPWASREALLLVVLALGVVAASYLVETGREAVRRQTLALVAAADPLETAAVRRLLAPGAVVSGPRGRTFLEAGEVVDRLQRAVEIYEVESHRVRALRAWADGGEGRSELALYSVIGGVPALTRWGLFWEQRDDGGWAIVEMRWLSYQGQPPPIGAVP